MKVLIVEDDESVARFIVQAVMEAGYSAHTVPDGLRAFNLAEKGSFDLILMDVMIPGIDGFEVCRRLRAKLIETPILLITAKDAEQDKIAGLDSGADDYIVKPFLIGELLARMRAVLRRKSSQTSIMRIADLVLEPAPRRVTRGNKPIALSATEYSLLEYLMRNEGRTVTRGMILDHVWQYDFGGNDNVLDVYISYLRNKVDKGHSPALIHTVRGVGYRLDAENVP